MKELLQDLVSGHTTLARLPVPVPGPGELLIRTRRSLVSAGTERMLVDFGRAGWLGKARQKPEKVEEVLQKARTDGLLATVEAVQGKLDQPLPLGYSSVGVVEDVGPGVGRFQTGDRVASNGSHAELVTVPENLCARVPAGVSDDEAAFTVIGSIALQGIRLAQPTLGECVVVSGLGLIGLLTVQLLRAQGCRILGLDPDASRVELAKLFGAEGVVLDGGADPVEAAGAFSRGRGVDGVLIAAATRSSEPVRQAARMCRKRGRIVLLGVTGLDLDRADFYEKELSFQVSCSYGPGRYDPAYEEKGQDYPVGFVRWTAQRNFEAVLDMLAEGQLDVRPLITHRFAFEEAPAAYDLLVNGGEPPLGILLEYSGQVDLAERTVDLAGGTVARAERAVPLPSEAVSHAPSPAVRLGMIGAGNYAGRVLIPAFRATEAAMVAIVNQGGVGGVHYGRKHGFRRASTDVGSVLGDPEIDAVAIATRHDSHASLVRRALEAGKHVFCEKPLALTLEEIDEIEGAWLDAVQRQEARLVMVGFNRRFSPLAAQMKGLLDATPRPKSFLCTVNAGAVPPDHWTQDPAVGGGRLVGEACHFIDLLRFLAGAPIVGHSVETLGLAEGDEAPDDKASVTLRFADGSLGTIHYLANGHRSFPKERVEVFCAGRVLQLDNFRALRGFGWPGFRRKRLWRQDKGQRACAAAFVNAVRSGGVSPIPFEELLEVSRVAVEVAAAARA